MAKIRVLVANRPRLMRELVLAMILDQTDIEVAGEISNDDDVEHVVARAKPDFVIIALEKSEERPALCDALLTLHPEIRILALAPERNSGVFFWSVVQICSANIESSENGILDALRSSKQGREIAAG